MEGVTSAAELQDQYLNLLVTQLRHHDPLNPTKQEDFLGQLAQFATVEGIENLNTQFSDFMAQSTESSAPWQTAAAASALLGTTIEFELPATDETKSGVVDAIVIEEGQAKAKVAGELVSLDSIQAITKD